MDSYGYDYSASFSPRRPSTSYPDHGDGAVEFYPMEPVKGQRHSRSRHRSRRARSRSRTNSKTKSFGSRSRSGSQSRSRSRSGSRSRSKSRSRSHSQSGSRKELNFKEPSFLDAFRVLYLTPSNHKKTTTKYLATKKRQDHIQEYLKSDGLGSKRWLFYPRNTSSDTPGPKPVPSKATCDQRIKIDGDFFRKYRRSKKVDVDAPIAKLKRWELVLYKKLGFVQAV